MLQFKSLEASHMIVVNGKNYPISESDVDTVWWHAADLVDNDHEGPAVIKLGMHTVVLEEDDWVRLYKHTHDYIQNVLALDELENNLIMH